MSADLCAENDMLREENRQLRALLGERIDLPKDLGLSPSEETVLRIILAREICTREAADLVLYGHMDDVPGRKNLDVFIHRIRKKLLPLRADVKTVWGRGWYMEKQDKDKIYRRLAEWKARVGG